LDFQSHHTKKVCWVVSTNIEHIFFFFPYCKNFSAQAVSRSFIENSLHSDYHHNSRALPSHFCIDFFVFLKVPLVVFDSRHSTRHHSTVKRGEKRPETFNRVVLQHHGTIQFRWDGTSCRRSTTVGTQHVSFGLPCLINGNHRKQK